MSSKPAWQRLGLQLKSTNGNSGIGQRNTDTQVDHLAATPKRKFEDPSQHNIVHNGVKRHRNDDQSAKTPGFATKPLLKKQKSVTFEDTPTQGGSTQSLGQETSNQNIKSKPSKKKPKKKKKKTDQDSTAERKVESVDTQPALVYLRQWGTSREDWKFNKNHQSILINHVFDSPEKGIPTSDISTFYAYVRDLKGFVRTRLREMALAIRLKDVQDGASAFPQGTLDVEAKQNAYESVLARFLHSQQMNNKRKNFDEADYVASSLDEDIVIQRVIKRFRADMVLDELSDSGETDVSTTTSTADETLVGGDDAKSMPTTNGGKKLKLNDGTGKRRRKLRTNMDDASSSSSSSDGDSSDSNSDSDSGSDDSSSSDDSDSDEEMNQNEDGNESSSSSSSSSGADTDSESESDEEEL